MSARILIIDDEAQEVEAWERLLKAMGHHVFGTTDAEKAKEECRRSEYDIAFVDHLLGSNRGSVLITELRRIRPTLRAVLVSGQLEDDYAPGSAEQNELDMIAADGFLAKPITKEVFETTIARLTTPTPGVGPSAESPMTAFAREHTRARAARDLAKLATKKIDARLKRGNQDKP